MYLKSFPPTAKLADVMRAFPEDWRPVLELHERILRGDSAFTVGERELLAAYVSGVNACSYCHGIHADVARRHGVATEELEALLADIDTAAAPERLKPVLRYADKLTREPAKLTPEDAEAVYAAGWQERDLYQVTLICALFNFMNRVVDGLGIVTEAAYAPVSGNRLTEVGYADLLEHLMRTREGGE